MTITYPLSMPTIIYPSGVTMTLVHVQSASQSPFTRQSQIFDWGSQAWQANVSFPSMSPDMADEWVSFALRLRGRVGTFLMGDPARFEPSGIGTGTPLVNGGAQTGFNLITDGWSHSVTGILKKGDYFQIGTGSTARLHKLTADANSDGSGNSTLEFTPKLRYSPADNAALVVVEPQGLFRMSSPNVSWSAKSSIEFGFSFDCEECLDVS